jgi:DNA-binding transcriptional LysR family regulator
MDLDLRKLRYFVAVAQHRHFGRAAQQLYIAQPVLSRQIRALERELGCALFERTTRSVQLTAAGDQLLEEARGILTAVDTALRRVHEAHRGVERLVVAFAPGLLVSEPVRAFSAMHPDVDVELLPLKWWDQDGPLRDGRADVGYLRRPFDDTGLRTVTVGSDTQVACLPATHRLARRRRIRLADLDGEHFLDAQVSRSVTVEEKFENIAVGHGIAVLPRSVVMPYSRPDLVYVDVADADPVETCIAVAKGRRDGRIRDFVAVALNMLTPRPLVAVD